MIKISLTASGQPKLWNPDKLYKKKAPKERERKKKQGAKTKVQASKQPKRGQPQGGKGITKNKPSTGRMKHINNQKTWPKKS